MVGGCEVSHGTMRLATYCRLTGERTRERKIKIERGRGKDMRGRECGRKSIFCVRERVTGYGVWCRLTDLALQCNRIRYLPLCIGLPLHPEPYTLHATRYTLHPAPYTLHPAPYTLHPTPYTLHPNPTHGMAESGTFMPKTLHPSTFTLHRNKSL